MKKASFILIFIIIVSIKIFSQSNYSEEYGRITQFEASLSEYENDKDAEAVIIYDIGKNYFIGEERYGFFLYMERRSKIKILKSAGLKYANIEIPFYIDGNNREEVLDIEATTYNWENNQLKKVELDSKNIFEERLNKDVYLKKIALSDVREGSIIEYKYKIKTPFFFHMRKWEFQNKIPVVHSKLTYKAIPYYEYTYIVRGTSKFDEFKSTALTEEHRFGNLVYKEMVYEFGMKNLPAFRDEEFISSDKDYMVAIDFQISKLFYPGGGSREFISTWQAMCDSFLKDSDFGKYMKDSEKEGKKIIPVLDLADKSTLEKAKEITSYVKKMYNWNGLNTKFTTGKLSEFLKQKTGNAAEINLFLIGLLKAADITVNPVVLSTRDHGVISKSHPFQQFLNYVIAEVSIDGNKHYIDATEPLLYFDELPARCTNVEGLVIKPKTEEWIITTQKEVAETQRIFNIKVNPESQEIDLDIKYILSGQDAYRYRKVYAGKINNLADYLRENNNIVSPVNLDTENYNELKKPFVFSFTTIMSIEGLSDKLFIHPFCNMSISDNPFKQNQRTLPVDLVYLKSEKYISIIDIPDGYKVEYLPKELKHSSRLMVINYHAEEKNNQIIVTAEYSLNNNIYDAKDYLRIKYSFNEIIKHFSDMVILTKI